MEHDGNMMGKWWENDGKMMEHVDNPLELGAPYFSVKAMCNMSTVECFGWAINAPLDRQCFCRWINYPIKIDDLGLPPF